MDGDQERFAGFYLSARDDCLRIVYASVGDRDAAEELVAEAFARAWARWSTVSSHPAPRAWIVRTALNQRISWWRKSRREHLVADLPETQGPKGGDGVDHDLVRALRRLPLRQREVVALRVFLDLDTQTTANVLGIASGTVTAHLARATASLKEAYHRTEQRSQL